MVKKKKEELKFITQDEIEEKIKNHLLILRWEKDLDNNFSWYHFTNWLEWIDTKNEKEYNIYYKIFEERNLESSNFSNSTFWKGVDNYLDDKNFSFRNSNLKDSDFKKAKIKNVDFKWANLEWVDIRWTDYNANTFSKEQLTTMILTDEDSEKYQEKKRLEKENKELKKDVTQKIEVIKNTSEEQTKLLTQSFEKLEKQFLLEEKRWLCISFIIFFWLFLYLFIPILDLIAFKYMPKILIIILIAILTLIIATILAFFNNWEKKNIIRKKYINIEFNFKKMFYTFFKNIWILFYNSFHILKKVLFELLILFITSIFLVNILLLIPEPSKSVLTWDLKYILLPLWILLSTFLYFSIYQYSKSKKLRIENSNKIALLHWFYAIRTDTWKDIDKWRFYDNVANVVFDKVYPDKESNLPIDKIIDLAKIINK